jgi:hypothetical protein
MIEGEIMNDDEDKKMRDFYQKELDRSVDGMDYLYVGLSMIDNVKFNDKAWVKDIFLLAVETISDSEECLSALDSITKKDCFDDKTWTRKLFSLAFEKLNGTFSLHTLADYIADETYLGDKKWARDVYNLAYEYSDDGCDMVILAASVQKYSNDFIFAQKIVQKARNLFESEADFNFIYEVYFDDDNEQSNH